MIKPRILFVCLGNICRSPSAETIFKSKTYEQKFDVIIDSAGTSGYHEGEPADDRMRLHLQKRGYKSTSVSRMFTAQKDFDHFDMIIAMDDMNYTDLQHLARNSADKAKIFRMRDFFINEKAGSIPDPYYGGSSGFDRVISLLEDASNGLLTYLKKNSF